MVQPNLITQHTLFDYAALDTETRIVVQQRTTEIKALMKRAASDIIEIGQKLIEVKTRLGRGQFDPWIKAEFGWERATAYRFIQVAEAFGNSYQIDTIAPSALYLLAAPSTPESAREEAIDRAETGETITRQAARQIVNHHRPTIIETDFETIRTEEFREDVDAYIEDRRAAQAVRKMRADPVNDELDPPMEPAQAADLRQAERKARINAGLFSSATPEWYTPAHIVEKVEAVFGQIDLDPCSNSKTDPNVPARDHYTIDDNGLEQSWHGRVYMNPPYGDEIATWVGRLIDAYESGEIDEGIALLPARTDTAWFQPLFDYTICFVRGRLKFSGSENSAPFPSVVIYLGKDAELFNDWFHDIGRIK